MTLKTKTKLIRAFERLVHSPSFHMNTLTIHSLSKEAAINRVTFYRQFTDMFDFLKWYILKDFIFHYHGASGFTFKDAFEQIFIFIQKNRTYLYVIFMSSYAEAIKLFAQSEVYAYQIRNFNRLDTHKVLSNEEVHAHASFYATGITHTILSYILEDKVFNIDPY